MPQIPAGWKETTLGDIVEIVGWWTPKTFEPQYWNWNIPWLSVVDFNNDNRRVYYTEKSITEEGLKNSSTKILNEWDLIISARWTVWALAQLKRDMAFNQSCYGIKQLDGVSDKNFLFYLLKNSISFLSRNVHWAVFDTITRETFDIIPIHLPPLPEQQAIAAVLSSFDDKIELLRAENQTLEQMGQELFKERFGAPQPPKGGAHFSHPAEESAHSGALGAEGKSPSGVVGAEKKSSSGVLGAEGKSPSGDLGASLPEGWRVGKLGEMGTIICWKTPSKNNWDFFWWNIPFIKIPDMHWNLFILKTEDSLTEEGADSQKNKYISEWAICVSCIATVGLVSLTTKSSQTNQQINSIIPKFDNYREYLYYSLASMKNELLAIGAWWSATLNINTTTFSNILIIIPDQETLSKFDLVIKPLFNKIRANSEQIQTLSATRDQLLPKLMSGEVRVEF